MFCFVLFSFLFFSFLFFQENVDVEAFAAHVETSMFTESTDKIKYIYKRAFKGFSAHLSKKALELVRFFA